MVQKMIFSTLVDNYAVEFDFIGPKGKGSYVKGEWMPNDEAAVKKNGAIIPYTNKQLFDSGGKYVSSDRQLYISETLPLGSTIIDGDYRYKIESEEPYAEHYADTNLYHLKAVSIFE